jgi:hypothetical protein
VPAAPRKPLSVTDMRLASARGKVDDIDDEGRAAVHRRVVARMEALIRQALKDGRTEDAEAYLAALKSLVPDYEPESGK